MSTTVTRGLFFDETDLARIRANTTDPRFAEFWQSQLTADIAADTKFLTEELSLTNHTVHLLRAQRILERASFVYLVNRDPLQLTLAKLAIRRMLDYPEWDSFLEGGRQILGLQRATEGTVALLQAINCLVDALTAEEIAEIEQAVLTKGVPACFVPVYGMKYPDRVQGWTWNPRSEVDEHRHIDLKRWPLILNSTNLKIIPTTCLGIAACYFHGRLPEAEGWLELARSSAKAFATYYGSDGSYDEGVSYWGYTTLYLAMFADVLWRTQGIDDRNLINYPGTVRYALGNTMPTVDNGLTMTDFTHVKGYLMPKVKPAFDIVNHGDSNGAVDVSVAAWVARTHGDELSQYVAQEIGEVKHLQALMWYDPQLPATPPETALLDRRQSNDIIISRTGWTAQDNVVALRSGGPGNHEHADRNSVIFKAYGERLLHDPFRAAYMVQNPRWILRHTEAHTAVLINGRGHQYHDGSEGTNASWAFAKVVDYATGPGWMRVSSDATDAYQLVNDNVSLVRRTLVYLKPDIVIILDQVTLKTKPANVQVRFQLYNEDGGGRLAINGNEFTITRPQASLLGQVAPGAGLTLRAGRLPLEPKDGEQQFAEVVSADAVTHEILTVCQAAPAGRAQVPCSIFREGFGWRVSYGHSSRTTNLRIDGLSDHGLPQVTF
jgi:hypothetical protein